MHCVFRNIAIIDRQNNAEAVHALTKLIKRLQKKKVNIFLEYNTANVLPDFKFPVISDNELAKNCDLIIVIGGDGSLLSAARIAARQNLPIVGINMGKLGFLTDITINNIAKIDEIIDGKFCEEYRFLLSTEMKDCAKKNIKNIALNDVVFLPYIAGHIINFSVHVDQQFVCTYHADGLIVTTPTGSTAHALSGGGPILHPELEAIALVPMLPHNLSSRPIIIKDSSVIKVTLNNTNPIDLLVRCDGQVQTMVHGSVIKIKKAKERLRLLHPLGYNYFETLRTKLHWESK
jgi:NAD+ kinase